MTKIALFLTLSLIAAPTMAADGNWQVGNDQIHVVDGKIDIATAAGRKQLLRRVERAAAKLCRDRGFPEQCETDTVRETAESKSAWGRALLLALNEKGAAQLATR